MGNCFHRLGSATPQRMYRNHITTPHVGHLAGVGNDWPTPLVYMSYFGNGSGAGPFADWPLQQRQFASAVWAQDQIVGGVVRELEAQGIAEKTLASRIGRVAKSPVANPACFWRVPQM